MDLETNSLPGKPPLENEQDVQDATDLAAMGHAQALTRKFDTWSMLALAFCVLGSSAPAHDVGLDLIDCCRNLLDLRSRPEQWSH